ncbi:MAG TPA: primosomal protein N' [Dehalococcoidia bacterium]
MPYAEVAVNTPAPHRDSFTYAVPQGLTVVPGQAVYVPFGSRTLQGVVLEVTEVPRYPEAREIAGLIDARPVLLPHQPALARWLADFYLSPLYPAVALMLPPGFGQRPRTLVSPTDAAASPPGPLTPAQARVLQYLAGRERADLDALGRALRLPNAAAVVDQLARRGLVVREPVLGRPRAQPKLVQHVTLALDREAARARADALRSARRHTAAEALRLLLEEGPSLPAADVRRRTGATADALRRLAAEGAVRLEAVRVERDPLAHLAYTPRPGPELTAAQAEALEEVARAVGTAAVGGPAALVLHGVTGSGKTEVYLRALEHVADRGKRGIVLVPEIALTPQTVRRFLERFPGRVAVLHSGLSLGEAYDQWERIRDGAFTVVIGSRGALFAPQPDLGLVVLDEEHEWTYKQTDHQPRYHAREVAERLAALTGAALVLGSATPDVVTMHRARSGRYRLLSLPLRVRPAPGGGGAAAVEGGAMPRVEVVDLAQELREGNRSIFSRRLAAEVERALRRGRQAILFLNRRGSASFLLCRDCGHVPRCSGCEVALTYHGAEGVLRCHQCNRRRRVPAACPACGGRRIRYLGIGTQKVEEEAAKAFPGARLLRWDRDSTRVRGAHERILERFLAHEADILIGTQMVAKGLDMPSVAVVGVVCADIALHLPDFRSGERAFQLLTQVAGRAGRGAEEGTVIIQTYAPEHYAVQAAARHDYEAFYQAEIALRRQVGYPPYGRLARLVYADVNPGRAAAEAKRLARVLRTERDVQGLDGPDVVGPAPAFVARVRGRYRWQILLKGGDPRALLAAVDLPQGWVVDVDPVSLL